MNKRAEPRFAVLALHNILLKLNIADQLAAVPLLNISTSGLGVTPPANLAKTGAVYDGELKLNNKTEKIRIEVRHQTVGFAGCKIVEPTPTLAQEIRKYLAVEMKAIELSHIDESKLNKDNRGNAHWYSGRNGDEIYFISKHDVVVYFHLSFLGFYVEGGERGYLKTGRISGARPRESAKYKAAEGIDFDHDLNKETLSLALRFIYSSGCVPPGTRTGLGAFIEPVLATSR